MTDLLTSIIPILAKTTHLVVLEQGTGVASAAAQFWKRTLGSNGEIVEQQPARSGTGGALVFDPGAESDAAPDLCFRLNSDGSGLLRSSHPRWLMFLAGTVLRNAGMLTPAACENGVHWTPPFTWCRNLSDLLVGSQRTARGFSAEEYCEQIALQGFTHVSVNGLGVPRPFESGPPGDMYFWFYDYSPDLDQFVDSALIRGYYPADYLSANLAALKRNAALARRYGLVPGLHINAPRSMPEEFWSRNGHLRGARVDHPRETFRPRYTLALAHPDVQEHYRELLRVMLREVPDLRIHPCVDQR